MESKHTEITSVILGHLVGKLLKSSPYLKSKAGKALVALKRFDCNRLVVKIRNVLACEKVVFKQRKYDRVLL